MKLNACMNWYKYRGKPGLEPLKAYCKLIEKQIVENIEGYERGIQSFNINENTEFEDSINHYNGLTSDSWNLHAIYKTHFPNLQRRSAFLTMYAFLEHELTRLAVGLKREGQLTVELDDIAGQGVVRALTYMKIAAHLKISQDDKPWRSISAINSLRNILIHNDGWLNDHNGKLTKWSNHIKQLKCLQFNDDEVILEDAFLQHVVEQFDYLFQYLDKAIKEAMSRQANKASS
jgi:hypothetical protein